MKLPAVSLFMGKNRFINISGFVELPINKNVLQKAVGHAVIISKYQRGRLKGNMRLTSNF